MDRFNNILDILLLLAMLLTLVVKQPRTPDLFSNKLTWILFFVSMTDLIALGPEANEGRSSFYIFSTIVFCLPYVVCFLFRRNYILHIILAQAILGVLHTAINLVYMEEEVLTKLSGVYVVIYLMYFFFYLGVWYYLKKNFGFRFNQLRFNMGKSGV